jgi:hypothetical protein
MFGLDDHIAALGSGEVFAVVVLIAVLLGLRHATDPDHLVAVTTLVASDEPDPRRAGRLGLSWGLGHATSLVVFGIPIVLFRSYLPEVVQQAAETAVGAIIVVLALRLLLHRHHHRRARSRVQAYGIGVVHGMGGSAGVGVLLLSGMPNHLEALAALVLFAICTAISMSAASTTFGLALSHGAVLRGYMAAVPAMAILSLAFGLWYSLGALNAIPYVF